MDKFPKRFYLKILGIVICIYLININLKPLLPKGMDWSLENLKDNIQNILEDKNPVPRVNQSVADEPENSYPRQIDPVVKEKANYQTASQKASEFNDNLNSAALNTYFSEKTGISVAEYLAPGAWERAFDLTEYNYLTSSDSVGNPYYYTYSNVDRAEYRLSEKVYDLYISASDIHLKTWQNSEILADYLYKSLQANEIDPAYSGMYLAVKAYPTDYRVNESTYVRLVVVLALDMG